MLQPCYDLPTVTSRKPSQTPEELLLRAALCRLDEAIEAWRQLELDGLDRLGPDAMRLVPLLYRNLEATGVDHPWLARGATLTRRNAFAMDLLFREIEALVTELNLEGVESMLLKGAALALAYYPSPELRPMQDFDLLVSRRDVLHAVAVIGRKGWHAQKTPTEATLRSHHGLEIKGRSHACDLHWAWMWEELGRPDEDLYADAVTIPVRNATVRAPSPHHQLLHVVVHGSKSIEGPSVRWVADAAMILTQSGSRLDWSRFENAVERRQLGFPVWDALQYLHDVTGILIPGEILDRAGSVVATSLQRKVYSIRPDSRIEGDPMTFLPTLWYKAKLLGGREGTGGRSSWLIEGLKETWQVDRTWKLPFVFARRGARKIGQIVGSRKQTVESET